MLWICRGCTAAYSVDAAGCPQCGSTEWVEQGSPEHIDMVSVLLVDAQEDASAAASGLADAREGAADQLDELSGKPPRPRKQEGKPDA